MTAVISRAEDLASKDSNRVVGEYVTLDGEQYFQIANSHLMKDFFMSLVGAGDHWMFISSNGALTAGRRDPDLALFPYAADDQISASRSQTGSFTLIRSTNERDDPSWEPFAPHDTSTDDVRRDLFKTPLGNKLVFQEINHTRQLSFRYRWTFSQRFGFVRSCSLQNISTASQSLEFVDGLRNVLPYGVGSDFMMRFSNLANAYKKSELIPQSELGLFYLSSIPTDRAEPSEGLKSTIVWQTGLDPNATLLSTDSLSAFRDQVPLATETDLRGKAGAFLVNQTVDLQPGQTLRWHVVADVAQDHCDVVQMDHWLQESNNPAAEIEQDVHASEQDFLRIVSSSDGLQCGQNRRRTNRHLSNTVFNVMRGGIPLENYRVDREDFVQHVQNFNRETATKHQTFLANLSDDLTLETLQAEIAGQNDRHLTRLGLEYLPLAFSRRHGDPTRPWNRFLIDLESDNGKTNLNYQGNWRDIFQNWEALLISFPMFCRSMVSRFVNATTADGYNPYRLTKDGFEWEEPAPEDPWSNIGYWGDHQIIYLLKLLEWTQRIEPSALNELLDSRAFTHANIPYRIKDFAQIKQDPRDTIDFDAELSNKISKRVQTLGADGKLLCDQRGEVHYVTLMEKLLTLSLAKLSNFIPDGGIWLNTQRPEWNDANNALVGNGLSMVTVCYLHRWFQFLRGWIADNDSGAYLVSKEVGLFFKSISEILRQHESNSYAAVDASIRAQIAEALSKAGSDYRNELYTEGLSGETVALSGAECLAFFETACAHLESTIRSNRRSNGLYHAYNLLDWRDDGLHVETLGEMLEGQVAVLSSGILSATEVLELLNSLRSSSLYREDQDSYILYPDRQLPRFLDKNQIDNQTVQSNGLLQRLLANNDRRIARRDVRGVVHFNGAFRNSGDLQAALSALGSDYELDVAEHGPGLIGLFEDLFGHRQFTGRSCTFFAYEGLGSIYWHMVSKLALAVSENHDWAVAAGDSEDVINSLAEHLESIRRGIGAEKSPLEYGAFPSDPYSHTPENAGVKQPGMTGQVKEDVLARFAELGVQIDNGCLSFRPRLFDRRELLTHATEFTFCDLGGRPRTISLPANTFAFTLFQVPVVYQPADSELIRLHFSDGRQTTVIGASIDQATTQQLFARCGSVTKIECFLPSLGS